LTTPNPETNSDKALFEKLGIYPMPLETSGGTLKKSLREKRA